MIRYKNIIASVNKAIGDRFPDIPIQSGNVREGFERPSFFTRLDNKSAKNTMELFRERKMRVEVHYFPKDKHRNEMELFEMDDDLEALFLSTELLVDGYVACVDELELDTIGNSSQDKVLLCSFELEFDEMYEEKQYENMEELHIDK